MVRFSSRKPHHCLFFGGIVLYRTLVRRRKQFHKICCHFSAPVQHAFMILIFIFFLPGLYAGKAEDCTGKRDNKPYKNGKGPAGFFGEKSNSVGGNRTSDICAGVKNSRHGRNLSVFFKEWRNHTYKHEINSVH